MFVAGLVSTAACKKEEKKAEAPATEPVAEKPVVEEPVVEEPVAEEPEAPDMANKMEHCPSSVAGSTTTVAAVKTDVVVTVTSKDKAATAEIRARAAYLVGKNDADSSEVKHSGEGTGGGALGKCPVVLGSATLAAKDVKGGSAITMTPNEADGLAALTTMATERAAALATGATATEPATEGGGGGGDGSGKGGGKGGGGGGGGGGGKAGIDAGA